MKKEDVKIFKAVYEESDWQYFVMVNPDIKHGLLNETYDRYGRCIGENGASDYCIANTDSIMHDDLEKELRENFDIPENATVEFESVSAAPGAEEVDVYVINEDSFFREDRDEEMSKFATDYARKNSNYAEADYINYWNGHNWQSIVFNNSYLSDDYNNYTEVSDAEFEELFPIVEKFNNHCDDASKVDEIDDYEVGCSRREDDPWYCYIR